MELESSWTDPAGFLRPTAPRSEAAVGLRAYLPWLRDEGLLEPLCANVSAQTAALLMRPPLPTAWIGAAQMDELYAGIASLRGDDAARAMALEAVRSSLGTLLRPLLNMYLKLSGSTPGALFGQLPALAALFVKGVAFDWAPQGPGSGELVIGYANAPAPAVFHAWKGMLQFAFELCHTSGEIAFRIAPHGATARFAISWVERSSDALDEPPAASHPFS